MTPHQQGRDAFFAGVGRFTNPFQMGSADFASWRNGHDAAQSAAVFDRLSVRPCRQTNNDNMNYGSR